MRRLAAKDWLFATTTVLAMTASLLALVAVPGLRPRDHLVAGWRRELQALPDELLLPRLRQIASLGDDGVAILVETLGSERESVAAAARTTLEDQMIRWQMLRSQQSSPKVAELARRLAQQVGQFGPAGRRFAADLATRILAWPVDRQAIDSTRLVADCEAVLRMSAAGSSPTIPSASGTTSVALKVDARQRPDTAGRRNSRPFDTRIPMIDLSLDLPGGDLPVEIASAAPVPTAPPGEAKSIPSPRAESDVLPGRFAPPPPGQLKPVQTPPKEEEPIATANHSGLGQFSEKTNLAHLRWEQLSDIDVMRHLNNDSQIAAAAERELRRRGFQSIHLQLAAHLIDPDPAKRRELAESLPRIANVDARPWLLWLSGDEDPRVRLTAVTIMATSGDRELHKRLREIDAGETDSDVRRQLDRLSRQQHRAVRARRRE